MIVVDFDKEMRIKKIDVEKADSFILCAINFFDFMCYSDISKVSNKHLNVRVCMNFLHT